VAVAPDGINWKRIYIGIVVYLAGIITVFYLFTKAYRPE